MGIIKVIVSVEDELGLIMDEKIETRIPELAKLLPNMFYGKFRKIKAYEIHMMLNIQEYNTNLETGINTTSEIKEGGRFTKPVEWITVANYLLHKYSL